MKIIQLYLSLGAERRGDPVLFWGIIPGHNLGFRIGGGAQLLYSK